MRALNYAQQTRRNQGRLKRGLRDGSIGFTEVARSRGPASDGLRLVDVITALPRFGPYRAGLLLKAAGMEEVDGLRRMRDLTDDERGALILAYRQTANG